MWPGQQFEFVARVATVVVPVALYFLILGLLNSRRHPQILPGRLDFALLLLALSPLFVVPVLHWVGISPVSISLAGAGVGVGILLLAPRGRTWVVYNASALQARKAVNEALEAMHLTWTPHEDAFDLTHGRGRLEVSGFPLLRNVSIRYVGPDHVGRTLGPELARALARVSAETPPSAVALLLVASAMMVAPLALMANHAGEIVRILTGLLN